jgi:hypothetical protein
LPHLRNAYMSKPHSALNGLTPYDMLYGFCPRYPMSNMHSMLFSGSATLSTEEYAHYVRDRKLHLQNLAEISIRDKFHKAAERRLRAHTSKRTQPDLKPGDLVIELPNQKGTLQTNTKGPFKVVQINRLGTHALLETGATQDKDNIQFVRHTSHLAPYRDAFLSSLAGGGGVRIVNRTIVSKL